MIAPEASPDTRTQAGEALPALARPLARWGARARALWRGSGREIDIVAPDVEVAPAGRTAAKRRISGYLLSFIIFVALPALATVVYLLVLASDQYVAETKFALRTAQMDTVKDKSSSSQGGGAQTASLGLPAIAGQDAYVVATYVRSLAILRDLPPSLNIREIFRRPEADFWARLPADASAEKITDYWRSMVSTYVDSLSGIVTVSARAFRRDDALALVTEITAASERLINAMSTRARADAMARAEAEVKRSEALVRGALADMRDFRNSERVISPAAEATGASTLLLNAMGERIRLQSELTSAERVMSASAPTLTSLRARLQSADQQIETLKAQLTGGAGKTVSGAIARYEELELQRQFSEKLYLMSQEALERARQKAERQSVYLSAFVPPSLPEEAEFPKRIQYSVLIPIAFLILWGIGAMLTAVVRDHRV